MRIKILVLTIVFALIFGVNIASAKNPLFLNPESKNGELVIKKSSLSKDATFVNYQVNGKTVQLIAVIADDNSYRLSFNTCQSCNPSPRAYFVQKGRKLVCQNCGNQFTMNDVGKASYGCNPAQIPFDERKDELVVSTDILEKVAPAFKNWQGQTE